MQLFFSSFTALLKSQNPFYYLVGFFLSPLTSRASITVNILLYLFYLPHPTHTPSFAEDLKAKLGQRSWDGKRAFLA